MTDQPLSTPKEELTFCAVHPDRETALKCNKCGRYMCVQCAVQTPVGYRCRECVRGLEDRFYNVASYDYAIVFGVCLVATAVVSFIVSQIGWLLIVIIAGPTAAGAISELAIRATKRRRGRQIATVATAGTIIGGVLPFVASLLHIGRFDYIAALVFTGLAAMTIFARFRMYR
jgi:hypothetical protein